MISIAVLSLRRGLRGSKLELSWAMLEHLGAMLGRLEAMLAHPGPMLGHLGGYVGASWGCLEPCWSHVAAKLVTRGAKQQKQRKNKFLPPVGLTDRWREMGTAGTVFLRFPSKMLLKPLFFLIIRVLVGCGLL